MRRLVLPIIAALLSVPVLFGAEPPLAKQRAILRDHTDIVWSVAFSPNGKTLMSAGGLDNNPGELGLWDMPAGKKRALIKQGRGIRSVAVSPDGRTMATGDFFANSVTLRDAETGKSLKVLPQQVPVSKVVFSPDGKTLAVALQNGTVKLWNVTTGKEIRTLAGHADWVLGLAFSPDGKTLASCGRDKTVRLWELATGNQVMNFPGHTDLVEYVAFSPDGKMLATVSWDKIVKLWEVSTGKERASLRGHQLPVLCVDFSPDGKLLASASGGTGGPQDVNPGEVKLWDVVQPRELARLGGHRQAVWSVAFSPDGKTLATASMDRTIKLWDIAERKNAPPAQELSAKQMEALWSDLRASDAAKAYQATFKFVAGAKEAVPFFQEQLKKKEQGGPIKIDTKEIEKWIAQLDSAQFKVREKATEELEKVGRLAETALRQVMDRKHSTEVHLRVHLLLEKMSGPALSPETIRRLRVIETLEHMGTDEAKALLQAIAKSEDDAKLADEAKESLERLGRGTNLKR